MAVRILLADDHQIVREGLRALLEREGFAVVGEAVNGADAVCLGQDLKPDVAILDLTMPRLNGLEAAHELLRERAVTHVILLTMHADDHQVAAALRLGVRGYVLKTQAVEDLANAIRAVVKGQTYLSPSISAIVVNGFLSGSQVPADPLAPRERQVLQLVAEGKTSKEVAALMGLSVKTAESYRTRVMEKLGIHQTAGLVRYATAWSSRNTSVFPAVSPGFSGRPPTGDRLSRTGALPYAAGDRNHGLPHPPG
jgi:DNA-binding NarL/FixJ family response regulator